MRNAVALAAGTALLFSKVALGIDAASPGPDWTEAKRTDDLVIFTRDDGPTGEREIVGVSEADVPPSAVFDVTEDYAHFTEFMPRMAEVRIIKQFSDLDLIVYERIDVPVVSDRDMVLRIRRTLGPSNGGTFKAEWSVEKTITEPVRDDVVRVDFNSGSWTLEPIDGGRRTRMTYKLFTTAGGSIPRWLSQFSSTTTIPDLFEAIKKRAAAEYDRKRREAASRPPPPPAPVVVEAPPPAPVPKVPVKPPRKPH